MGNKSVFDIGLATMLAAGVIFLGSMYTKTEPFYNSSVYVNYGGKPKLLKNIYLVTDMKKVNFACYLDSRLEVISLNASSSNLSIDDDIEHLVYVDILSEQAIISEDDIEEFKYKVKSVLPLFPFEKYENYPNYEIPMTEFMRVTNLDNNCSYTNRGNQKTDN